MDTFIFLKKCNNKYAGEGKEWYETLATTEDYSIAKIINDSIPYRSDRDNIICILMLNTGEMGQFANFNYSFTHYFDESLEIR